MGVSTSLDTSGSKRLGLILGLHQAAARAGMAGAARCQQRDAAGNGPGRRILAQRHHLHPGLEIALAAFEGAALDIKTEEHTAEIPALMRIPYDVFCLKKKKTTNKTH